MKTSEAAYKIVKESEGLVLHAYVCSANRWTIGWGHTKGVKPGMKISISQAEQFLQADMAEVESGVSALVTIPLKQYQFDALCSFAFNVGLDIDSDTVAEGLGDSTLLKLVNAGNFAGAALEFEKWVTAKAPGGKRKTLEGLVARRRKERALFEGKPIV